LYVVLLLLTVAAYLPVWSNGFVDLDDELYITTNPQVIQGLSWSGFGWAWTNFHGNYWMPLTWLSLQWDAHWFSSDLATDAASLSPAAFHAQNLFWHTASVLLLFGLWLRLTQSRWGAFLVAALFAVHPMHVESVAWAVERKDVLSGFFGILTLWAYVRYREKPGAGRYLGVAAAFLASLLAKPMLMTIPCVLLLLDYWPLRRLGSSAARPTADGDYAAPPTSFGRLVLEKVPLILLALGAGIVTLLARGQMRAFVSWTALPFSARLANALTAYGWYLFRTFWPVQLGALYPHPATNWSMPAALAGAAALLTITGLAVAQRRRRPWLLVGWFWFVGTLVPVIGLAQGGGQAWADRFSYWPHIGLFVAIVWELVELANISLSRRLGSRVCAGVAAAAIGLLALLTFAQAGHWRSSQTLWERALAVSADNHYAHLHLGALALKGSQPDKAEAHFATACRIFPDAPDYLYFHGAALLELGREEEAATRFKQALSRDPHHLDAWYNLGVARLRQGKPRIAQRSFGKVVEAQPGAADALAGMGLALLRSGQRDEAIRAFEAALKINPREAQAWQGLGLTALARGRPAEAVSALGEAVRLSPGLATAHSDLGLALGRTGQWDQAASCQGKAVALQDKGERELIARHGVAPSADSIRLMVTFRCRLAFALQHLDEGNAAQSQYRAALQIDPLWPEKFAARAWSLATDADPSLRDPQLAHELASQATQAVDDPSARMLDVLAAAQAALGQLREAAETARLALTKATGQEIALIRDHLVRYERDHVATQQRH
jgi:tetratricopeptide (TPR) repeat protein